eukprot:Sspe_Gene.58202::Locus_31923_Transcript_1_1_Confidence_1.000_Length_1535::g.58202::m.58202
MTLGSLESANTSPCSAACTESTLPHTPLCGLWDTQPPSPSFPEHSPPKAKHPYSWSWLAGRLLLHSTGPAPPHPPSSPPLPNESIASSSFSFPAHPSTQPPSHQEWSAGEQCAL